MTEEGAGLGEKYAPEPIFSQTLGMAACRVRHEEAGALKCADYLPGFKDRESAWHRLAGC
jgi:hypothetical protein